jgi:hypothetical protein
MRIFAYALATAGLVAASVLLAFNTAPHSTNLIGSFQDEDAEFAKYIVEFGKEYSTKEEYELRKRNYFHNLMAQKLLVEEDSSFTLGVNKFSDWTREEYRRILGESKVAPAT